MTTRAKFILVSKTEQMGYGYDYENKKSVPEIHVTLKFTVVSSGSEENKSFFASTPSGTLELNLARKEHADQFELLKEYYADLSPAN